MDKLTWPQLMALYEYWTEHPPTHILVHGVASGMSGRRIGKKRERGAKPTQSPQHITDAGQLMGILGGLTQGPNAILDAGSPAVGIIRNV